MAIRFPVQPRDVPAEKAARLLHLTLEQFDAVRTRLEGRGFPRPDQDTGMYDLKAIDAWMDRRSSLTAPGQARDAREVALDRIERMRGAGGLR